MFVLALSYSVRPIFNAHALKHNSSRSMTHTASPLFRSAHKNLVTKTNENEYFFLVRQDIFFLFNGLIMKVIEIYEIIVY